MMKNPVLLKIVGVVSAVLVILISIGFFTRPQIDIVYDDAKIREVVSEKLPYQTTKLGFDILIADTNFEMLGENSVRLMPKIFVTGIIDATLYPTVVAEIGYDKGSVYLSDVVVEEINLRSASGDKPSILAAVATALSPKNIEEKTRGLSKV